MKKEKVKIMSFKDPKSFKPKDLLKILTKMNEEQEDDFMIVIQVRNKSEVSVSFTDENLAILLGYLDMVKHELLTMIYD